VQVKAAAMRLGRMLLVDRRDETVITMDDVE
jgi:hypothetical protein